jgi:hypothetical protein
MSTAFDSSKKKSSMKDSSPLKKQDSIKSDFFKRKNLINKFLRETTIANAVEVVRMEG